MRTSAKSFTKTADTNSVKFDGLSSNTEYKVSVTGHAETEPETGTTYAHVRTKRAASYLPPQPQRRKEPPVVPKVEPPQAAYARTPYTTKQTGAVDTSKFDKDATIITECKRIDQTDLVILIDGSWSVTPDNFVRVQTFLAVLLKHFTIGPDATLIGIAQYSDNPRLEFGLDRYTTTDTLIKAVEAMKYKGGNTASGKALTFALDQVFGRSSRPNAQKVVLVITDGESLQDTVTEPARRLRENGVEIFSIGVGDEINLLELQDMATDPDTNHVFQVGGYNAINGITSQVLKDICRIKVLCADLLTPAHGSKTCTKEDATVGVLCNFACDQG